MTSAITGGGVNAPSSAHLLTPGDEQPSDDDVNMILINESDRKRDDEDHEEIQDEPQDLRVPRVNVEKPTVVTNDNADDDEEDDSVMDTKPIPPVTSPPMSFPVVLSRYPPYFLPGIHPLATSLPPDFRFQLSTLTPPPPPPPSSHHHHHHSPQVIINAATSSSSRIIASDASFSASVVAGGGGGGGGGHTSDGKMISHHRHHHHHHRPAPYHKVRIEIAK